MAPLRTVLALLFLPLLFGTSVAAPRFEPIGLSSTPIKNFRLGSDEQTFGTLRFLGGLAVESDDERFGALSGLDVGADGRLVAVADTGYWFSARLVEENGRLTGIQDGRMARLLDDKGFPLIGKRASDAEGLRIVRRDGHEDAYVSFEQINIVRRYRGPDYGRARAEPVKVPLATAKLPRNEGLEGIALAPAGPLGGALLLFAEHALNGAGNHRAFIVGGPRAGTFAIVRSDDFDVTDATFLPDGDLLILERRFTYTSGVAMRLRLIAAGDIRPGATVDGVVLIDANMRYQIDNMEGVAAHRGPTGETVVDIVSDDNKSIIQRTLILRFALTGSSSVPEAPAESLAEPGLVPQTTVDASPATTAGPPVPRPRPSR